MCYIWIMFQLLKLLLGSITRLFCARRNLLLENLTLRQQLAVFKRRHPRPKLHLLDKLFWVAARRGWSDWKQSLIIVLPETVVKWHRAGFDLGRVGPRNVTASLSQNRT